MELTRIAINRPVSTAIIFIALSFLGVISWFKLPIQLLPNLSSPQLTIQVAMPGASPEQIEREVVSLVEGEIGKIDEIEKISSFIRHGGASITAEFKLSANMKYVALKLEQKIGALSSRLPETARVFVGRNFDTEIFSNVLMSLSVRGEGDVNRLRRLADDKIKPELEKIDGIVNVGVSGGRLREVQIDIDEYKAREFGININDLINQINAFNRQKEYLGRVRKNNTLSFVTFSGQVTRISELENLIVNPVIPLKLKDIADIRLGRQNEDRIFRINGLSSVGIFLLKDSESNLLQTSERTLKEIDRLNEVLEPEGVRITVNLNAADFMGDAIYQVEKLAVIGALLALLVLLFFLRSGKTVSVILISIPVSLLVTFNLMYYWGVSVNLLSLVGLAIAIGMLVDNSIVVLENIFRHYEMGKDAKTASLVGCTEVTRAIVASTATTIIVFVPVLFMEGMYRVILLEVLLSIAFPLLVSLLVAFTLIPMYASQILMRQGDDLKARESRQNMIKKWQQSRVMEIFTVLLKSRLRSPGWTIILMLLMFIISPLITIPLLSTFTGVEEESQLPIYIETPPGTGLAAIDFMSREIELLVDSIDFVKEVRANILPENATITIEFLEKEERGNAIINLETIRKNIEDQTEKIQTLIAGSSIGFETNSGGGRTGTGGGGPGGGGGNTGPFGALFGSSLETIRIKGQDQESMRNLVSEITQRLRTIPEINRNSVRSDFRRGADEIQLWGDQAALAQYDLTLMSLMQMVNSARREGQEMTTKMKDEDGDILIRVRMVEKRERNIDDLYAMTIPVPGAGEILVADLVDIIVDEGPRSITRVFQERQSEVTYEFNDEFIQTNQDLDALRSRVDQTVHDVRLPQGFTLEIIRDEDSLFNTFLSRFLIAFVLMYFVLASTFESIKYPIIIFASIPMAIIGSLWFMVITGTELQIFAFISYLVLLGIVVNNGIILIDYITILRKKHGFNRNRALIYATRARVRPILMTSVTTILGVLPLAVWPGTATEVWKPFAISLIGGLVFATLLTLVYLPVLYVSIDDFIDGMKRKGTPGIIAALLLNAGTFAFIWFWWLESLLYQITISVFFLTILNVLIWSFYKYLDNRLRKIELGEDFTITIRNLTKIYNDPGKFMKDWTRRKRRQLRQSKNGGTVFDAKPVLESLIWKIPALFFIFYFHYAYAVNIFSSMYWLTIISVSTFFLLFNILGVFGLLIKKKNTEGNSENRIKMSKLMLFGKIIGVLVMFAYLWRMGAFVTGWAVFYCIAWWFVWYARTVSLKVYNGEIVIENISGRFVKWRRKFYRLLLSLPVIGRKKIQVRALHGVNLTIRTGMFGLLGPNGAGKSTLMRLIANLIYQSRGVIYFNDYKLSNYRDIVQKYIGYLPQIFGLYGDFTAWNYLNFIAILNRWGSKTERHQLVESVIRNVNLWDKKDNKINTFSGGMKQRVGVAQALLNLPKIIIVDEPTAGLDPMERIRFRNMLAEMSKNRIVIFSTHIVEDISTSCREVAVLEKGKVIFEGTPETMRLKAEGKVWESLIPPEEFAEWNKTLQIVTHIRDQDKIKIKYIREKPVEQLETTKVEPTLEDAYLLMLNPL